MIARPSLFVFLIALCAVHLPAVAQFRSSIYGLKSNEYSGVQTYLLNLSTNQKGNAYMIGFGNDIGVASAVVSKTSPRGDILWQRKTSSTMLSRIGFTHNPTNQDAILTEVFDTSSRSPIATDSTKFSSFKFARVDSNGNFGWSRTLKTDGYMLKRDVAAYEGNIFAIGVTNPITPIPVALSETAKSRLMTPFVMRVRKNGSLAYIVKFEGLYRRAMYALLPHSLAPMPGGKVAVLHQSFDFGQAGSINEAEMYVTILDSNGAVLSTNGYDCAFGTFAEPTGIVYRAGKLFVLAVANSQNPNASYFYSLLIMRLKANANLDMEIQKEIVLGPNSTTGEYITGAAKSCITFSTNGNVLVALSSISNIGAADGSQRGHNSVTRLDSAFNLIHTREYGACPTRSSSLPPQIASMPGNVFIASTGLGAGFIDSFGDRLIENALISPPDDDDKICRFNKRYTVLVRSNQFLRPVVLGPTGKAKTLPYTQGKRWVVSDYEVVPSTTAQLIDRCVEYKKDIFTNAANPCKGLPFRGEVAQCSAPLISINGGPFTTYDSCRVIFDRAGTYVVRQQDTCNFNVSYIDTIVVGAGVAPADFALTPLQNVCAGDFVSLSSLPNKRGYSYKWQPVAGLGSTDSLLAGRLNTSFLGAIDGDTALQYKLTVSAKGVPLCKIEKQVQVRVRAAPTGQIDTVGNANTLVATYVRGDLESWSVFGGFLGGNLRSDTVQVSWQQPWANSHKVLSFLVNQYDCKATLVYPRPEVIVPPALPNETANNIATRNEDQANEYLTIDNQRSNLAYTMQVSNRWGKVVHSGTYTPTAWPKADTPVGTYFFTITAPGRPMLKGWFEVVR